MILAPHRDWLLARIKQQSDVTLHGLKDELKARGVKVSHDTIWRYLRREKMSFKKSLFADEQMRPDIVRRRRRWKAFQ